jgi:hypothetical protein
MVTPHARGIYAQKEVPLGDAQKEVPLGDKGGAPPLFVG